MKLHITQLKFHYFTKDGVKRAKWVADIYEGFVGFKVSDKSHVLQALQMWETNVFVQHSNNLLDSSSHQSMPHKTRKLDYKCKHLLSEDNQDPIDVSPGNDKKVQCNLLVKSALLFYHFTRDSDVKLYTGCSGSSTFRLVGTVCGTKAQYMDYWKGLTNTANDLSSPRDRKNVNLGKLSIGQEFLLATMCLRVGVMIYDVNFRFDVCWQVHFSPRDLSSCLKNLDGSYFGLTVMLLKGTFKPAFESIIHSAQLSLAAQKDL